MRICIDTRTLPAPKEAGDPVTGRYCRHRRAGKDCRSCPDYPKEEKKK